MKASKTENRFETTEIQFAKNLVLTSLPWTEMDSGSAALTEYQSTHIT